MKIITYPNPILTTKTQDINLADFKIQKLRKLIKNMIKTMHKAGGAGLAAPQIGKSLRICAINSKIGGLPTDLILINPNIIERSIETNAQKESCLSLLKVQIDIARHKWVKIMAVDFENKLFYLEASDLFARVIQHEIDHLDGVLIIDK